MPSVALFVAVLAVIQATGEPGWASLAASPAQVAHGEVWLLLTSGLVIEGLPWAQLALLAAVLVIAVRRLGTAWTWAIALTAHVGAALIAYAGVGALWLIDSSRAEGAAHQADYGVSVILAGVAGALAAGAPSRRAGAAIAAVAVAALVASLWTSSALTSAEHALGLAIGAALGARRRRRRAG